MPKPAPVIKQKAAPAPKATVNKYAPRLYRVHVKDVLGKVYYLKDPKGNDRWPRQLARQVAQQHKAEKANRDAAYLLVPTEDYGA